MGMVTTDDGPRPLLGEERRRRIARALARQGAVQVTWLSRDLGCSEATLRRDLQRMEDDGLLRRTHGGAVVDATDSGVATEPSLRDKAVLRAAEKQAIATAAARLIAPGDVVALNGGTTTVEVARRLRDHAPESLRVLTNSVGVAVELADVPGMDVMLTGGSLRGSLELSGPLAEQSLRDLYVDTAFIGVDGLTVAHGLTTYNQAEAYINRAMMGRARRVVVVADHTKIGRVTMALIAPARAMAVLVTDALAAPDELAGFRAAGVEVIVAP